CIAGVTNSVYDLYLNNDKLEGEIRDTTGTGAHDQVLTGTTIVADGIFHHVAMERDITGNVMRLYVDGAVDVSASLTATDALKDEDGEADPVTIGAIIENNNPGTGLPKYFFNGTIDEVEYFNRALSTTEIAAIAN